MANPFHESSDEPFVVSATRGPNVLRLALVGELDVAGAERLAQAVDQVVVEVPHPATIVVDLQGLEFLDLVGARALAGACDRLGRLDAALEVAGIGPSVARVLEVAEIALPGVDTALPRVDAGHDETARRSDEPTD
jgi:anti-anti-sigma factor